jgi:hypothetical protein
MLVEGVCFQRPPVDRAIVGGLRGQNVCEKGKRLTEKHEDNGGGFIDRSIPHSPISCLPCNEVTKSDILSPRSTLEFDILPSLLSFNMARAPAPSGVTRRCICGCATTNIRTMNKHMKKHSQRLNIKTTQLASLTAVFRSKKRSPPVIDDPSLSAMEVDEDQSLPEPDGQAGDSGVIPEGPALQFAGNETDDGESDGSNDTNEGPLIDSDSGDEFESDWEDVDESQGDRPQNHRGPLEFELRAAEAGNIPANTGT